MSCYFRHLGGVFASAGLEVNRSNRQRLQAIIEEITGEQRCPAVWRKVEASISRQGGREEFILRLRGRWREETVDNA